ncbi:MAG: chemotaxis protein CheX [Mariprofundaceae bacterium]|nr:chemotaxis protein CheX [Mariprofundaceae bacterium]
MKGKLTMFEKEILQISQEVWHSVVNMDLHLAEGSMESFFQTPHMAGVVHISGAWNGICILRCPRPLVEQSLASIIGEALGTYDDVSLADALGELTNIIGGNFKALLPTGCALSLPVVLNDQTHAIDLEEEAPAVCVSQMMLQCKDRLMVVELYKIHSENTLA